MTTKSIKFKDDNQKKETLIANLRQLKESIGWKIVVKALNENIKSAEARLYGNTKLEEGETIEQWQKIRQDRIQMIELPDVLIAENEERDKFDPKLDPFE